MFDMNNNELILSKRMKAVVDMIPPQSCNIADIGCDHAYVSIYLKRALKAEKVIAMDVRKGPLDIARKNIFERGLKESIDVRLSDGLSKLVPGEVDTIIIAGMGGLLIKDILLRGMDKLNISNPPVLILQPQSDIREVRIFLYSVSYHIEQEMMLKEDGKYYTVIRAVYGKEDCFDREEDITYGRYNIENKDKVLIEFLENEKKIFDNILSGLNDAGKNFDSLNNTNRREKRISEIKDKLSINRTAYGRCMKDEM